MNKTININLAGVIFHVDEPAFEKLNHYLKSIRQRFGNEQGADEILHDIEARIAELFQMRTSESKQVITMKDVDEVIGIMGKPEDYEDLNDDESGESNQSFSSKSSSKKKNSRRIYRDEDNAVIGGVCSGAGAYLGIDPVWLRLLFVLLFLGFGTGVLLYIILWIVIPEAKTTAEKLEMRGEPVNINNIEKSIKEELDHLKERINDLNAGEGVKSAGKKAGTAAERILNGVIDILKALFGFLGKILGILLVFFGLIFAISFIAWLLGFGNVFIQSDEPIMVGYDMFEVFRTLFVSDTHFNISLLSLILLVMIPLLEMIYGGLRLLFSFAPVNPIVRRTGGILWTVGLVIAIVSVVYTVRDFEIKMPYSTTEEVVSNDTTLYLHLQNDEISEMLSRDRSIYIDEYGEVIYLDEVTLDIKPSNTDKSILEIERYANGSEKLEARERAEKVTYALEQQGDRLFFPAHLSFQSEDLWRNQEVRITLYLKPGQEIYLEKSLIAIIYDIENVHNMYDSKMVDHYWLMTEEGLRCQDCPNIKQENENRPEAEEDSLPAWGEDEDQDWPTT
jgi:phage shock protein PspC (stress-responsive transcriptional regulator)